MQRALCFAILMMVGLPLLALAQPDIIVERGSVDTPGISGGVRLDDKTAFVVEGYSGTFRIVDVSDKDNPITISAMQLPGLTNDLDIDRANEIAYIGAGFEGIHVVDYSDMDNPILLSTIQNDGHSDGIEIDLENRLLFNADRESSFDIYDIDSPTGGQLLFSNYDGFRCRDVEIKNGLAYVVWDFHGLQIFDYSEDPSNPTLLSHVDLPDISYDVIVDDRGYCYVAGWYSGVQILDVTAPEDPQVIATLDIPGNSRGIRLHPDGNHMVFTAELSGMYVYDISIPHAPMLTGNVDTPFQAKSLEVGMEYAYVCDGERFTIYELGESVEPPEIAHVHGYVSNSIDQSPVDSARVYYTHVETFTDDAGHYEIENMVAGTYWVEVTHPAYNYLHVPEVVLSEGNNFVNFTLSPIVLDATVIDSTSGDPIPNALVTASGMGRFESDLTNQIGQARVHPLEPGYYVVTITADGYRTWQQGMTVGSGGLNMTAFMQAGADILLTLIPLDWPVVVPGWGGSFQFEATITTGPDATPGTYRLWNEILPPGQDPITTIDFDLPLVPDNEISAVVTQQVPYYAWSGVYVYSALLAEDGSTLPITGDSFSFRKLPLDGEPDAGPAPDRDLSFAAEGWDKFPNTTPIAVSDDNPARPTKLTLQAAPNPFNATTTVRLTVPNAEPVSATVYNIQGQRVAVLADNEALGEVAWLTVDAQHWSSGVYFLQVATESGTRLTQKLVLLR